MIKTTMALSIRQPWAWLIVNGHKDIENRDWGTGFRGPLFIHAGKTMRKDDYSNAVYYAAMVDPRIIVPDYKVLLAQCGGIVGEAKMIGCVTNSNSPWFQGKFGFVLADAKVLPFKPCKGKLGFFRPDL
jgi:ASCH domain